MSIKMKMYMKKIPAKPAASKEAPSIMTDLIRRPFRFGSLDASATPPILITSFGESMSSQHPENNGNNGRQETAFTWVITKTADGKYFYQTDQEIIISQGTDAQRVLDALIVVADADGIALFSKIDARMVLLGCEKISDVRKRNLRISHSIGKGQGFMRRGWVGKKKIPLMEVVDVHSIIRSVPGKGYQLINP